MRISHERRNVKPRCGVCDERGKRFQVRWTDRGYRCKAH